MPSKSKDEENDKADYVILESREDGLLTDTTMKEKIQVFHMSRRISTYLRGLLFAAGGITILVSAECLLGVELLLAPEMKPLFLAVLAFTGAVNMVCGLLLLAKE